MRVTIEFLREARTAPHAEERLELIVHLLNVLTHVAALSKLLAASGVVAGERAIFCVQAHMVDELRTIGEDLVAAAAVLALEQSCAVDLRSVLPAGAEHGVSLTARQCPNIIRNSAEIELRPGYDLDQPLMVDGGEVLKQLPFKIWREDPIERQEVGAVQERASGFGVNRIIPPQRAVVHLKLRRNLHILDLDYFFDSRFYRLVR